MTFETKRFKTRSRGIARGLRKRGGKQLDQVRSDQISLRKTIVVPFDFSSASEHALDYGISHARSIGGGVRVVHVLPPSYGYAFLEKHQKEEMQTRAKESAVARLEKVVAPNSKHVPITVDIRSGLPEYEILKAAEEANAKLIVIGRKTRGAWNRWILGSVTENVLEGSRWPVLVLTPEPNSCTKGFGVRKFKAQSSNNQ